MPDQRRNKLEGAPPQWADVRGMLHMRIKDAAAELNVPITYLRRLCHENGFPHWPGKQMRYMNGIGRNVMLQVDARDGSTWAGTAGLGAGPSQMAKTAETKKKEDEDITGICEPVANHPPREELLTLNLIDKVGSSSSSERSS